MSAENLEQRLAALEAEVERLREQKADKLPSETGPAGKGWEAFVGAFVGDPYFKKAMEIGRRYRESLRPKKRTKRKRANGNS